MDRSSESKLNKSYRNVYLFITIDVEYIYVEKTQYTACK